MANVTLQFNSTDRFISRFQVGDFGYRVAGSSPAGCKCHITRDLLLQSSPISPLGNGIYGQIKDKTTKEHSAMDIRQGQRRSDDA
jgi:hypothetical protein